MVGEKFCLWSGPGFLLLFGGGLILLAGFMPAPAPGLGAEGIAAIFQQNTLGIRAGAALMMLSGGLMLPFFGLISARMQQIPDCSRSLVNTQMICGAVIAVTITFSALLWGLAAFRPDRDPALTQMLNDLAWLWLLATTGAPAIQPASIGLAILGDKREQPMFPRWAGFMNLWIALLFVPGVLALFFLTGPFAWNGLFPYWIPFAAFAGWFLMMFFLMWSTMSKAAVR